MRIPKALGTIGRVGLATVAVGLPVAMAWGVMGHPLPPGLGSDPVTGGTPIAFRIVPVTTITLAEGIVPMNGIGEFALTADVFPEGLSGFNLTVGPTDAAIAQVVGFTHPAYGIEVVNVLADTPGGLQLAVADLNGLVEPGAVDVELATVRVAGMALGETTVTITLIQIDDDIGDPILTLTPPALMTVGPSRDLDGDGLTEDINGNGQFDFADIKELFDLLVTIPSG